MAFNNYAILRLNLFASPMSIPVFRYIITRTPAIMFSRVVPGRIGHAAACCIILMSAFWSIQTLSGMTWQLIKHSTGAATGQDTPAPMPPLPSKQHQGPSPEHILQSGSPTPDYSAFEKHLNYHQGQQYSPGLSHRPDLPGHTASPLNPLADFPKKVWHIDIGNQVDEEALRHTKTWQEKNPSFRQEFITGTNAETFVSKHFSDRPELLNPFLKIGSPILRADILRHLILLAEGGVYADLDVDCRRPVADWIPEQYKDKVSIVVGLEMDFPDRNYVSMASWTIYARPGNRKFEQVLLSIYDRLNKLAESHNATLATIGTDVARIVKNDVIVTTGPEAFTRAMFDGIGIDTNTQCDMRNATDLKEPLLLSDVLILPINSFGDGQLHSHSGEPGRGEVLVHHNFKGSWLPAVDKKRSLDAMETLDEQLS
ncbi:glycosyl transferase sugar-binding region (DXD) protein [Metarhizium robertsii]|uniref:Glycosyl transferase sugar-binding region (DXD) protein n=1 Tax=Metarhizium robertsii TaxID=568076 RepID=A0A014P093_9HYPO|nr:glycosyl transferase sugar-binding region (DXD) protein [Metarhizium robertsii]